MPVLSWMRVLTATAIVIGLSAIAGAAEAREASIYRGECGEVVLPSGPTGLSSAIRIETRCGAFAIDGDGVRFLGMRKPTRAFEALSWRRGRLRFHRAGRVVWRSAKRYDRRAKFSLTVADERSLAFQQWGGPLYMANFGAAERPVGRINEFPIGWTRAGMLVTAQEYRLQARSRSGRVVPIRSHRRGSFSFDERTRTLLFVSPRKELMRTDGRRPRRVASLASLGLGRWFQIAPLPSGGIVLLGRRLVVLDRGGATVASDRARGGSGGPAEGRDGMLATVATRHLDNYRRARESVRLLRRGERSSKVLFAHTFSPRPCAHMATLAWRGTDLLYWTTEGHVVVIDTRSGKHIDLTPAARRLPGALQSAAWA
jgi:hypothetical protein